MLMLCNICVYVMWFHYFVCYYMLYEDIIATSVILVGCILADRCKFYRNILIAFKYPGGSQSHLDR